MRGVNILELGSCSQPNQVSGVGSESSRRSESSPELFSLPLDHSPLNLELYLEFSDGYQTTMAPKLCALCAKSRAILKRPKTGQQICKECFFYVFETEVHNTITQAQLFKPGDRVAIGASGGKGKLCYLHPCVVYPSVSLTMVDKIRRSWHTS